MPTLDELTGLDMMGDPSTVPGGSQERFLMGLLSHAASQKGYQALQLPALALLLRGQLQGFDQQRAQQQKQAEAIKAIQLKHLIAQIVQYRILHPRPPFRIASAASKQAIINIAVARLEIFRR